MLQLLTRVKNDRQVKPHLRWEAERLIERVPQFFANRKNSDGKIWWFCSSTGADELPPILLGTNSSAQVELKIHQVFVVISDCVLRSSRTKQTKCKSTGGCAACAQLATKPPCKPTRSVLTNKKPYRYILGIIALREIWKFQKCTNLLVCEQPFLYIVREID